MYYRKDMEVFRPFCLVESEKGLPCQFFWQSKESFCCSSLSINSKVESIKLLNLNLY